ncbi:phage integrase N-terminal SAM-like domain-containing protein [Aeribacillus composti]|uniref:phage integrase N-terminal SAM-like domain-containing protein n=1 Tax=Aeribacillus composti TaxID=1868734 RepID=UPI002E22E6EF|nr:phage integrase N-terminal SAM-like domain-containing protein [Aeribacillus composti]
MTILQTEGYRKRTINDYRNYWSEFIETIGVRETDNINDITVDHFDTLLNVRKLSPVTINIRLGGVKSIFSKLAAKNVFHVCSEIFLRFRDSKCFMSISVMMTVL